MVSEMRHTNPHTFETAVSRLFRRWEARALLLLVTLVLVPFVGCTGSTSENQGAKPDAAAAGTGGGSAADAGDAGGQGGSEGLDASAGGFGGYSEVVLTDAWCAPPPRNEEGGTPDKTACCNDTPCYGKCVRHSPDGAIDCECDTVVGGCKNGSKCCEFAEGCVAADSPCPGAP